MNLTKPMILQAGATAAAIAVLLAAGVAHSTGTRQIEGPELAVTEAEAAFADAPYGVDPMVTGPTSASFKQQQAQAGCAKAVWPDVPLACYPNR